MFVLWTGGEGSGVKDGWTGRRAGTGSLLGSRAQSPAMFSLELAVAVALEGRLEVEDRCQRQRCPGPRLASHPLCHFWGPPGYPSTPSLAVFSKTFSQINSSVSTVGCSDQPLLWPLRAGR